MVLALRRSPGQAVRPFLKNFTYEEHYGVSRLSDRLTVPDKYFLKIKNGYINRKNWVEQRQGFEQWSTNAIGATTKIRKLFEFENKTGGRTVIGRAGTAWYRWDSAGAETSLDGSRGSDLKGQCAQFNNELLMCDGGAPRKSTAAWSVSDVGASAPSTSSAVWVHNHRVVLNDDSNYMQVYISKVDSLDFDTATSDAIILNLSKIIPGGDRVIGFGSIASTYLVIFLNRHVVIYNVPTTFADIQLYKVIFTGCISYDGVINTPDGDIWFPSETGYKSILETAQSLNTIDIQDVTIHLGQHYRTALTSISDLTDINGVYYQRLNHAYFTLPFANNPELWVISKDLEAATNGKGNIAGEFTNITAYSFVEKKNGDLLFGSDDGLIYKMDTGTDDDGTAISFEAEKTGLYFGDPRVFKSPREFEALLEITKNLTAFLEWSFATTGLNTGLLTETISLTTQVTFWGSGVAGTDPQWDVSYWDASGQELFKTRNLKGRGKVMNIRIRHATLGALMRFPYWILGVHFQGDK